MPFVEAHQFKGVFADPEKVRMADDPNSGLDAETRAKLRAVPIYDGKVSIQFTSNNTWFDVQEDHLGQYMVLPPERDGSRPRVNVGEWICLLASGRFIKLTDDEYKAMA